MIKRGTVTLTWQQRRELGRRLAVQSRQAKRLRTLAVKGLLKKWKEAGMKA